MEVSSGKALRMSSARASCSFCSFNVHSTSTQRSLKVHSTFSNVHSRFLNVHSRFTPCSSKFTQRSSMFTRGSLHVPQCSLDAHSRFTPCSSMFTECSLSVHLLHKILL
jgi:hypothetical protein